MLLLVAPVDVDEDDLPTGHSVQLGAPDDGAYEPAAQGEHIVAPANELEPALQLEHIVDPDPIESFPAAHCIHGPCVVVLL